jgi:hypothetical protein
MRFWRRVGAITGDEAPTSCYLQHAQHQSTFTIIRKRIIFNSRLRRTTNCLSHRKFTVVRTKANAISRVTKRMREEVRIHRWFSKVHSGSPSTQRPGSMSPEGRHPKILHQLKIPRQARYQMVPKVTERTRSLAISSPSIRTLLRSQRPELRHRQTMTVYHSQRDPRLYQIETLCIRGREHRSRTEAGHFRAGEARQDQMGLIERRAVATGLSR